MQRATNRERHSVANYPTPRVLVVDDNSTNRLLVVETLSPENIEVVEAASGDEALTQFVGQAFDVVLMDVRMPGLDGFATLARLRSLPGGDDVPVLFLTALRDIDTFDRAREAGAVDFLTKPVRPTELLARVETALRLRRLGAEVREQLAEIRRQRDDLLRTQLQKERLTAFIVHDLKNPLASMRLYASILERTPDLPEAAREATGTIRDQCDRLNHLVMNLLDVSKADEGRLVARRQDVALSPLVREVATELGVQAEARRVRIEVDVPADLRAQLDLDLFRRVLANLVDNALRHTPRSGSVWMSAGAIENGWQVRVEDTGPGIPEALRDRIFDPFVQIDGGSSATRGGRGLGLAFCRAAVIAHGGTIHVDGTRSGASFVIRIPAPSGPDDAS